MSSLTSVRRALRSFFPWAYEAVSRTSFTKDGWNEVNGWSWLPSRFMPEVNQAISADRKRLWQVTKKLSIPGNAPCQHRRWYAPNGLNCRRFQCVAGLPSAFAGLGMLTCIPQGGEGALALMCCMMKGGQEEKNVRRWTIFVGFVNFTFRARSCRVGLGKDNPDCQLIEILLIKSRESMTSSSCMS
jgi:hypothetical protein